MRCPNCGSDGARTLRTTTLKDGTKRRRRECATCLHRFNTAELPLSDAGLLLVKVDDLLDIDDLGRAIVSMLEQLRKAPKI